MNNNLLRKFGLVAIILVVGLAMAACMPGVNQAGEGGGTVLVGGQGGAQPAQPVQPAAQPAAGGTQPAAQQDAGFLGGIGLFFPIILMFGVMWLLVIRPQRKQAKATKTMQEGLRTGDNVMTTSGFYGKIVGMGTDAFLVEFGEGSRGVKIWVRKSDIAVIKSPTMTPPPSGSDK